MAPNTPPNVYLEIVLINELFTNALLAPKTQLAQNPPTKIKLWVTETVDKMTS